MTRSARRAAGLIAAAVALALLAAPAAFAAGPLGSLSQLASPNNCIESLAQGATADCGTLSTTNLAQARDVVMSPDGKNVYVLASGSVSEFARRADGSLVQLPGCVGTNAQCGTGVGVTNTAAMAISPDGNNVYVVGTDNNNIGDIAEFARNADGSLTQLGGANNCIGEHQSSGPPSVCGTTTGHGVAFPGALAVSPDGANVYVADRNGYAVAEFARGAGGSLAQLASPNNCFQEQGSAAGECGTVTGRGLSVPTSLTVSPDGANVYVGAGQSIAKLTRNAGGSLTQPGGQADCIENQGATSPDCTSHAGIGISSVASLAVSPDGHNLYSASTDAAGAVAEFARNANGSLSQLSGANSCIEENATGQGGPPAAGCGTQTGHGLGCGDAIKVSPDGANVYVAAVSDDCGGRDAVAQFARRADGSLAQLASPNDCIEEHGAFTPDCGNETGHGVGSGFQGAGLAISPDAANVYTAGDLTGGDVAEFARALPTLTVSLAGTGGDRSRTAPARSSARLRARTRTRSDRS